VRQSTIEYITDKRRLTNGLPIRRPLKKSQLLNETSLLPCMSKFDDGRYSMLQFLRAAGHSVSHAEVFQVVDNNSADTDDDDAVAGDQHPSDVATAPAASDVTGNCRVCLMQPRSGVALVPCGHARFCSPCENTVSAMGSGVCRTPIQMVMHLYQ